MSKPARRIAPTVVAAAHHASPAPSGGFDGMKHLKTVTGKWDGRLGNRGDGPALAFKPHTVYVSKHTPEQLAADEKAKSKSTEHKSRAKAPKAPKEPKAPKAPKVPSAVKERVHKGKHQRPLSSCHRKNTVYVTDRDDSRPLIIQVETPPFQR